MSKLDSIALKELKDIDNINGVRKNNGLPLIKPKNRKCLLCNGDFRSHNAGNRICVECKK